MHKSFLSVTLLAVGFLTGCVSHPGAVLEVGDSGRLVTVKRGENLTIRLAANHTTGYAWTYKALAGAVVEPVGERLYLAEKTDRVGSGGVEIWQFRAIQHGQGTLKFEYRRAWEKDVPAGKTVTYTVEVK
jgi:inhibitor of cysteine peptidase